VSRPSLKKPSKTDWARVDATKDSEIDYSEIPELDREFFQKAVLRMPEPKTTVTIRLDRDVLNWFKREGRGYQTRINALLRAYMEAQKQRAG
jgi:uncharacterized protein (DUF4415 family)